MAQRTKFSQRDVAAAIRAVQETGLPVAGVTLRGDGEIDVRVGKPEPADMFDATDMRR